MGAHFMGFVGVRKSRSKALTCWGSASGGLGPAGLSPELSSLGTFFRWGFILKSLPKRLPFPSLLFFTSSFLTAFSGILLTTGASTCSSSCSSSGCPPCSPSPSSVTWLVSLGSVARLNKSGPPFFSSVVSAPTAANTKVFLIYIKRKGCTRWATFRTRTLTHRWCSRSRRMKPACGSVR